MQEKMQNEDDIHPYSSIAEFADELRKKDKATAGISDEKEEVEEEQKVKPKEVKQKYLSL